MLTIKGMLGLGSGLLLANGISPLIPTLFLSLIFLYSSAVPLAQVGSLFGLVLTQISSVHGISQARILEWVAFFYSRRFSQPRIELKCPELAGRFFITALPRKPICS